MTKRHQIYFLQRADGLIKIGTSTTFESRLSQLAKEHGMLGIIRVINGGARRERSLHAKFKRFHEYGEWFRPEKGALVEQIDALEEGPELIEGAADAATEWQHGEAALTADAREKIAALVELRRQRTGLFNEAALAAVTSDYGFAKNFLTHIVKGRALTVSAYGLQRIKEAHTVEMHALLAHLQAEVREMAARASDDEILAIGADIEALEKEFARRVTPSHGREGTE